MAQVDNETNHGDASSDDSSWAAELLTNEEQDDLTDAEPEPKPISFSSQDFDVNGLVRRMNQGDIKVPTFGHDDVDIAAPGFQRGFVWRKPQMDRFIESLLLGYPIPGVFLVRQPDNLYLVLDGQQRLRTMKSFYDEMHDKKQFALDNVADELKGLMYSTLPRELRRKIDDSFISATIVSSDGSSESLEAVYQIFERLNAGGTQLTPHEIRIALYAGNFIDALALLNDHPAWRELYGKKSSRVRDHELILRILALSLERDNYSRPLKTFLNNFTAAHRNGGEVALSEKMSLFKSAADLLAEGPGRNALRKAGRQVNTAQADAIFVGLMERLASGSTPNGDEVTSAVEFLKMDRSFDAATARATADEEQVKARIRISIRRFGKI